MDDRALEFLICDCSQYWRKLYTLHTANLELIGLERRIILTLHHHTEITQVMLADKLEQEPQSLTRVLDRLEEKKLIVKKTHPQDRRAKCLSLTLQGNNLYRKIMKIADNLRPKVLDGITQTELDTIAKALEKIKKNLVNETSIF